MATYPCGWRVFPVGLCGVWRVLYLTAFTLQVVLAGSAFSATGSDAETTANRLMSAAAHAASEGDKSRRVALLNEVVRLTPDWRVARWQLGQMQVDGQWLAVEEAQRRASADPRQSEYRELRRTHGETPQGQLALARWCRTNKLDEEARFHWASVLAVDPNNEEALRAIDARWHHGQLLTQEEAVRQRERLRELKQAEKRWSPTIAKWRRAIASGDPAKRGEALDEIRALRAVDAIQPLERVTLAREVTQKSPPVECALISRAFVEALAKMPEQEAVISLTRHAVFSPLDEVRTSAVMKLKSRPLHDYVPLLLDALQMPIESSFHVKTEADGSVHYWHCLYREGQDADWSLELRRSAVQHNLGSRKYIWDLSTKKITVQVDPQVAVAAAARAASIAAVYSHGFSSAAVSAEMQIGDWNLAVEALNSLVIAALTATTGQDLGDNPKAWWEWWRRHSEYYASEDRPVERYYDTDTECYYHGGHQFTTNPEFPKKSCLAKGTLVWTKTGQRRIETIELGDLVLAQDVESGELAFKPVIARTLRPPSEILRFTVGGESLRMTRGHPLWASGVGWRMAKELSDGAVLHGVTGSPRIEAIQSDGEEEAYNLVVADFNTYFVGQSGILVHDNTPHRSSPVVIPGVAAK